MTERFDDALKRKMQFYQMNAKGKGRSFELTYDAFRSIVLSPCSYCGLEAEKATAFKHYDETFRCNGIDRIDSSQGYTPGNVVSCCTCCNAWKGDFDAKEWLAKIHHIAKLTSDYPGVQELSESKEALEKINGRFMAHIRLQYKVKRHG